MTEYKLFTEQKYDRICGYYHAYGIAAFDDGALQRIVKDISPDKEKILQMTELFNSEGLELTHLSQAVEEFLYDFQV